MRDRYVVILLVAGDRQSMRAVDVHGHDARRQLMIDSRAGRPKAYRRDSVGRLGRYIEVIRVLLSKSGKSADQKNHKTGQRPFHCEMITDASCAAFIAGSTYYCFDFSRLILPWPSWLLKFGFWLLMSTAPMASK